MSYIYIHLIRELIITDILDLNVIDVKVLLMRGYMIPAVDCFIRVFEILC